jgi:hypothetical protein
VLWYLKALRHLSRPAMRKLKSKLNIFTASTDKSAFVSLRTQRCHLGLLVRVLRPGVSYPSLSVDSDNTM